MNDSWMQHHLCKIIDTHINQNMLNDLKGSLSGKGNEQKEEIKETETVEMYWQCY